jgi:hypothetical protein
MRQLLVDEIRKDEDAVIAALEAEAAAGALAAEKPNLAQAAAVDTPRAGNGANANDAARRRRKGSRRRRGEHRLLPDDSRRAHAVAGRQA